MKTITLPTTLHCAGCIDAIKPFFNNNPSIKSWSVDLKPAVKTITVSGGNVSDSLIKDLLVKAGYDIAQPTNHISTDLPPIAGLNTPAVESFWNDNSVWKRAGFNTLNCLIGCSIGDFSAILFIQKYYPGTSMLIQMAVATICGLCTSVLLETCILKWKEQFDWKNAFITAMSMSFISMVVMEIAMNITDFMFTGGSANFSSPQYWLAFLPALIAGFIAPLPYNYYKLKKYNKACH